MDNLEPSLTSDYLDSVVDGLIGIQAAFDAREGEQAAAEAEIVDRAIDALIRCPSDDEVGDGGLGTVEIGAAEDEDITRLGIHLTRRALHLTHGDWALAVRLLTEAQAIAITGECTAFADANPPTGQGSGLGAAND